MHAELLLMAATFNKTPWTEAMMQSSRGWVQRRQTHTRERASEREERGEKCSGSLVVESGRDWGNRVPPFSRRWQLCLSTMDEQVCHSFLKGGNHILSIYLSIHLSIYYYYCGWTWTLLTYEGGRMGIIFIHSFIHSSIHPFIHSPEPWKRWYLFWLVLKLEISFTIEL
jgi:hypothetical protein